MIISTLSRKKISVLTVTWWLFLNLPERLFTWKCTWNPILIRSSDSSSWKGPLKVSSLTSSSKPAELQGQTRLFSNSLHKLWLSPMSLSPADHWSLKVNSLWAFSIWEKGQETPTAIQRWGNHRILDTTRGSESLEFRNPLHCIWEHAKQV